MREFFTDDIDFEEPPLAIVSTLAIIGIIMHLLFPQHTIVAETKENIKPNINKESSIILEGPIFIEQENELKDKKVLLEGPVQKVKVIAVQIENESGKKSIENNKIQGELQSKRKCPGVEAIEEPEVKNRKLVVVTAYSSTVDQCDSTPFITANGTHVHDGTIAANFLKFGTRVRFPSLYGDKIFIVEDRMKSNYKVDIWFPTRQEAKNFGVKRVEIEILE